MEFIFHISLRQPFKYSMSMISFKARVQEHYSASKSCPFVETILHNVNHRRYKVFERRPGHDAILGFQNDCNYDNEEPRPYIKLIENKTKASQEDRGGLQ